MSHYELEAELREKTGRGETRRLRRAGRTPAVIYGGGKPELAISLETMSLSKLLNEEAFHTSMISIKVKGSRTKNEGLLKDSQWDPLTDEVVHLDFHRVSSSDIVHMEVPVHASNFEKCPGVVKGGSVEMTRHALEVACRADAIPEAITVDCGDLDIGDSVHVEDLQLPEGVEVPHEVNFTVLTLAAPTKMEVEAPAEEEAAEGEAPAEGAAEASEGE
jgi:large subunit ribosomal protein L25